MKPIFSILFSFVIITFLFSCGSQNANEANNTEDSVILNQSAEQITDEETDTDIKDLIYLTFMNKEMQAALGEVIETKSTSSDVQSFATDLVQNNKEISAKIEDLAEAAEMQLPGGLEVKQQQKIDSIMQLSPEELDKAFINLILEQQKESIELLQELASNSDNTIIRGLASEIADAERSQIERAEIVQQETM